jgi:hypothetical protein
VSGRFSTAFGFFFFGSGSFSEAFRNFSAGCGFFLAGFGGFPAAFGFFFAVSGSFAFGAIGPPDGSFRSLSANGLQGKCGGIHLRAKVARRSADELN